MIVEDKLAQVNKSAKRKFIFINIFFCKNEDQKGDFENRHRYTGLFEK